MTNILPRDDVCKCFLLIACWVDTVPVAKFADLPVSVPGLNACVWENHWVSVSFHDGSSHAHIAVTRFIPKLIPPIVYVLVFDLQLPYCAGTLRPNASCVHRSIFLR